MNGNKYKIIVVVALVVLATMACTLSGLPQISFDDEAQTVTQEAPSSDTFAILDTVLQQDALVQIYEDVSPGVVSIRVYSNTGAGSGSGFVVDKEGHIVTNYHVVQGAVDIEVHFQNGLKVYGEVIGEDLDSDLAVVRVEMDPDQLVPLRLGDSDQVRVGQTVVAIGNPYGLNGTMTVGIVSARGRTLESIRQTAEGAYFSAGDLIQTDATINPGNSGGPLLNLNGEVIGINRAIQTSGSSVTGNPINTGIGFAVSSNILELVLPALQRGETYNYPYLGLSALSSLSLTEAEYLGLTHVTGAYVVEVLPGGPADQAGVRPATEVTQIPGLLAGGDLIIGVDGSEILQFSDMLSYMMLNKKPGDEMQITVLREAEEIELTVILGSRSETGL